MANPYELGLTERYGFRELAAERRAQAERRARAEGRQFDEGASAQEFLAELGVGAGEYKAARYDREFAQELANPESVVAYLGNKYQDQIRAITNGISAGTDDGLAMARQNYDELNDTVSASTEALSRVATHPGAKTSKTIARYQDIANDALLHTYNQQRVQLPDGTVTTVGQFFQNPTQFNKSLSLNGYSREVHNAYNDGRDPQLQEMLRPFMSPALRNASGSAPDAFHVQNRDGALAVYKGRDEIKTVFGDGANTFTDRLHTALEGVGGYDKAIPALCAYASRKAERRGISGAELASSVMSDFQTVFTSVVRGAAPAGENGGAVELSPDSKALLAATTFEALGLMEASGQGVDISDPVKTRAFMEVMAARARAKAAGYGEAFDDPGTRKVFGEHVANAGTFAQGQGLVSKWFGADGAPGFLGLSKSLVTGGAGFVRDRAQTLTAASQYGGIRLSSGGASGSPTLDNLASQLTDVVAYEFFLPRMKNGESPDGIVSGALSDNLALEIDGLVEKLDSVSERFGVGDPRARRRISGLVINAFRRRTPVNLEAFLKGEIARRPASDGDASSRESLRLLYEASRSAKDLYREDREEAKLWLMSEYGLTERYADTILMSMDMEQMSGTKARVSRGGRSDPTGHYRAILNSGWVYRNQPIPEVDEGGNPVVDPETGKPKVSLVPSRVWSDDLDGDFIKTDARLAGVDPALRRLAFHNFNQVAKAAYIQYQANQDGLKKVYDTQIARERAKNADIEGMINAGTTPQ